MNDIKKIYKIDKPDCVDSVQPWLSLSPVACICTYDFETIFSPAIKQQQNIDQNYGNFQVSMETC